jgi:LAS superfamily LD-carboxypeptidase LdcB
MKMSILDAQQLTGRSRTHVSDLADPRCTLQPDAARAFMAMRAAAALEQIDLQPSSSFRDFQRQLSIWNDKFSGRRVVLDRSGQPLAKTALSDEQWVAAILLWSALPGASRHHWGTELDVFDRSRLPAGAQPQLLPSEYGVGGAFERLHRWLERHAEEYGFFRPYDRDRGGVQPEPWHISYAPISSLALQALTVPVLSEALTHAALQGSEVVLGQIGTIHARYVCAVAEPSAAACRGYPSPEARLS